MTEQDTNALAEAVSAIAREAGQLAMAKWRTEFDQWEKAPGDPVSEVDLAVNQLLHERLTTLVPDAGWLSEETADNADRLTLDRLWVVDPIDGTRDFVRGKRGWAVSIALVERGQPLIGVLDAPARDEHWLAVAGGGAWRNNTPLSASSRAIFAGARVPTDALPRVDADLQIVPKPNSIALRIAMVAADEADLVATLRWGSEWDIAAAVLIAAEAGAAVSDAFGAPLSFNTPSARAFGVLATAPAIHADAVARLAERAQALSG